jgi:hypothetical protein
MALFQSNFFSWSGQKERLSNVAQTIKAAVTLQGVQSNTGNRAVDKVLSSAASNPYATAAVIATGVSAAGYKATASGALAKSEGTTLVQGAIQGAKNAILKTGAGAAATTGAATIAPTAGSNAAKTAIIAGAAGVAAGYILSGSSGADAAASSNQNPSFNPTQETTGQQEINQIPSQYIDNTQNTTSVTENINYGAGSIYSGTYQDPGFSSDPYQNTSSNPLFDQSPGFTADQETSAETGASASASGSSLGLILGAVAVAYLLSKN